MNEQILKAIYRIEQNLDSVNKLSRFMGDGIDV